MPRAWVELATTLLAEGTTTVLVGTRALLGEGWNCRPLNVLVDMTIATTGVSVQQMRGRSLRLDPADPEKVASNWDVVCVAPDLVRGTADYERFVRKHLHLFAPAEDGEVEAGPSHVHPELGPFTPAAGRALRASSTPRSSPAPPTATAARERWQVGTPYRGVELPTLLVRAHERPSGEADADQGAAARCTSPSASRSPAGSAAAAAFGALGLATGAPPELAGLALAPAGLGWAAVRLRAAKQRLPLVLPLDARRARRRRGLPGARRALPRGRRVADDRAAGGGLPALRADEATPAEGKRFAAALDELCGVSDAPRYLVSRPLADPRRGAIGLLGRVLTRKPPFDERLHPVPPTWRATRSAPRRSRAPGGGTSARAGSSSRSAPRKAARRAPRRRPPTAATRR